MKTKIFFALIVLLNLHLVRADDSSSDSGQTCSVQKVFEIKFKTGDLAQLREDHGGLKKASCVEVIRVNTEGDFHEHRIQNNCCPGCPVYEVFVLDEHLNRIGIKTTCCQYYLQATSIQKSYCTEQE